jgi:hypothetical protein
MKATILLNHTENTRRVEDEEKTRFLKNILEQMGVPIQEFWTTDDPLTLDQRIKLRSMLGSYGVQCIDDFDGNLDIYVEKEKIASFIKPTYKLKRDLAELDPRKQLYLEMSIECESLFDENEENNDQ